ncbi:hypothetical protein Bca4012_071848 [Brassica carinata]|uniref:Uncharacterized protein n=3 Tax=Brassica TaxID=3705 RepID=A0A0D2ZPV8_BRAOL|nr:PREDICTED: uncharacterized protein LOC106319731 [Brassica oleracea var. oleracea]CAF1928483.1 unnamed protein product [Brassica napus]CDY68319.1 BnaCnng58500D [Brassica napus]
MMQKCSLSNRRRSLEDDVPISDRTFEINSHISVPCHLEQCLNLKTGEVYYINRKTGINNNNNAYDDFSGESDVAVVSEDDSSYYESEESSSESSIENHEEENEVLVVAGCKACFIYYMVPKLLKDCPKCAAQLLHFDRNHSASP